ncbi:hypothetical protein C6P45_000153 [Maudiozyma exigua]|uniref:Protein FMP27, mitochondrial n=1 Tax=Maudiozyma exigua TaxID=34358 RepID=A0A9P6WA59_MAUEX|nr:hypothetical protein C6P45_000153 [Kazachstania exigua]
MFEDVWEQLFQSSKFVIILLMCYTLFQKIVNALILGLIRWKKLSINYFSFNFILGTTVYGIRITTGKFDLRISKLHLKVGWKPSINFHGIDLIILDSKKNDNTETNNNNNDNKKIASNDIRNNYFDAINETFNFRVNKNHLFWMKRLLSLNTFIRSAKIRIPHNDLDLTFNLCTLTIMHKQDNIFVTEYFIHGLTNTKTKESVNYVGFHLSFKMSQTNVDQGKYMKLSISEWHTSLKIGDAHVKIDKHTTDKQLQHEIEHKPLNYKQIKKLVHMKASAIVKSLKNPLRSLNVLDIKVENVRITCKQLASINISSIQLYLEAVNVANYDTALDILPPNKHMWGDYEIAISANSILFKIGDLSTFRIPLINIIITTNIILHYAEDFPFNKTSFSITSNIVNPSIFSTISEITKVLKYLNKTHPDKSVATTNNVKRYYIDPQDDLLLAISKDLTNLPNIIFEFNIANFTSTFQIADNENIILKVLNLQSLLGRCRTTNIMIKDLVSLEGDPMPSVQYNGKSSFLNFVKVVGTEFSYLKLAHNQLGEAISIPICGFERLDLFLDEFSRTKLAAQCTLRHAYVTFDDIVVLERLHSSSTAILEMISEHKKNIRTENGAIYGSFMSKSPLEFAIKLRMKDFTLSTVIASFIPEMLDPLATETFNLSDIDRGARIIIQETIVKITNTVRTIEINDAYVYRVMDNNSGDAVSDAIICFTNLNIVKMMDGMITFNLPAIRFNLDVNLIWLVFYLRTIYKKYIPSFNEVSSPKVNSDRKSTFNSLTRILNTTTVNIDEILVTVTLPEEVPVLFVLNNILYSKESTTLYASSLSMMVQSVYVSESKVFFHLLDIYDLKIDINSLLNTGLIQLDTSSIYIHTEYHFKFYMVLDNIITAYKSFKQLRTAFSDLTKFTRVYPAVQLPAKIPKIRLLSGNVFINIEEDLFEQELGLILKVGILEQRERLAKLKILDEDIRRMRAENRVNGDDKISETNLDTAISVIKKKLDENFSISWVSRMRKAKLAFNGLPNTAEKFETLKYCYTSFSKKETNTVASLVIKDLDANLQPPSFEVNNFDDFVYKYGKGVPKGKSYTLLILMGIDFKTSLWELKLRDYPIPILSLPDTHTTGDIVFAEKMPERDKGLHTIFVPFIPVTNSKDYSTVNSIYCSNIVRTMNSVKTYFNIKTSVKSALPTHITWGKSLQPGFESFMLWFDYLTKPRLDPSAKLGFWDKFRFLFHGTWVYYFSENSDVNINIKGAHDPYKIVDDGAGLTFCWSGGTALKIHSSSDPKEFLKFQSRSFKLGVRDFTVANKFEKIFMQLDGDVVWKMGLLFESGDFDNPGDTPRVPPSVPHYDIQLVNPNEVKDIPNYDSYEGFRSNFIHMAIGVYSSAKGSSKHIYLGPVSVGHFLTWWRLFNTYTSGPIRQGPLFSDLVQNKTKFTRSLFSFKYQLHLEPLTISHIYRHFTPRDVAAKDEKTTFTGIKARINSLKIDLHQKRIKLIHTNEKLNKSKPVWKFRMFTGEIDCTDVDLRAISAIFDQTDLKQAISKSATTENPIDEEAFKNNEWFNLEDYLDLDQLSLKSTLPTKFDAIPVLYSPKISYFRKLNDDGYPVGFPFGGETSHDCMIGKNHPEKTQAILAHARKKEIESQIRNVELSLSNLGSVSGAGSENNKTVNKLKVQLHELEHRLHIIHDILNDLRLSEVVSHTYDSDSEESSLRSSISTDSNSTKDDEATDSVARLDLLRTNTIDSFISMRRASTVQIDSTYDNRFMVHNIQLKIDKNIRDLLLEYASKVFERRTVSYAITYNSIKIFKELLSNAISNVKTHMGDFGIFDDDITISNREFIRRFDDLVKDVPDDRFDAIDRYLFRLISPQIQITSELERDTTVLVSARDIEIGIIDILQVMRKSGKMLAMDLNTVVETRYCAIAKDLQLITLYKEQLLNSETKFFHKNGYGMDAWSDFWPPWIPLEVCYDGSLLADHIFLKRRSMFMTFTQPNPLYFAEEDSSTLSKDSKFRIGFPGLVLTSNSEQYCSVYTIIQDLLSFSSEYDEKVEKLSKVLLAEEIRNNLDKLDVSVLTDLQTQIKELYYTRAFLKQYKPKTYARVSDDMKEQGHLTALKLTVLMTAIKKNYDTMCAKKSSSSNQKLTWTVGTDELIWKLFDDHSKPFITIGLSPSTFTRTETSDGVNVNKVSINALSCFNQQESPVFTQLLAPFKTHNLYDESIPMIEIYWIQGPAGGGITSIEELLVKLQPIIFKMDNNTARDIMEYLFPKVDTNDSDKYSQNEGSSPPMSTNAISPRSSGSFSNISGITSANKELVSWDLGSTANHSTRSQHNHLRILNNPQTSTSTIFKPHAYNIDEMLKRSSTYFNVKFIKIERTIMSVSYKGSHHLLTDVNRLNVRVPDLIYRDKLWSRDEFIASLKHDIIKVVVRNMGSIIGNKFLYHKKEDKGKITDDMNSIIDAEERDSKVTPTLFTEANRSNYSVSLSKGSSSHSRIVNFKKLRESISHSKSYEGDDPNIKPFFPSSKD